MEEEKIIIQKILEAKNYQEFFYDLNNWKHEFNRCMLKIHVDKCSLPEAKEAALKLLEFKNFLENGKSYKDDAGTVTYFHNKIIIEGDDSLLKLSYDNYNKIKKIADDHFSKYMPFIMIYVKNKIIIDLEKRAIPLSELNNIPQEHLNWILNRLLEYMVFLHKNNIIHAGINPDSIFVVPETHGIIVISFYHTCVMLDKLKTISGKYANFYPSLLFENKIAVDYIDVELAKRTIMKIAGDTTGIGVKFKKILNKDFMNFILEFNTENSYDIWLKYRTLIKNNFEKKFYELNI